MTRHRTLPDQAAVAGWAPLDDKQEITVLPVLDPRFGVGEGEADPTFARLTYADALKVAKRYDATLPTPDDLKHLADVGLQLFPFLGTPTAETSLHHSKLHDADVWRQLRARDWVADGAQQPVAGAGKHWVAGAPEGRSRLMGWDKDGPGPGRELWNPDMVAHNRHHHDDGTTTLLVRPRQRAVDVDLPPVSDTDPAPPPSGIDDDRSHGQRCVDWMIAQMNAGVREQPDGSNNGPEIGPWLEACQRDGQGPEFGKYLKRRGANWCAASACAADAATRRENDPPSPCGVRCSGFEIEADAKAVGAYRPLQAVLEGTWEPLPGDFVHMRRGDPRKASDAWKRHVTRFVRWVSRQGPRATWLLETIGGNEGNRFRLTVRQLNDVLCFVEMRRPEDAGAVDLWSPPSQPPPAEDDLDGDGDNGRTRDAWPHMDPSPWVADDWHGIPGALITYAVYKGVVVRGEDSPRRTKGQPVTLRKIDQAYHAIIEEAHELTGVARPLIAATIATESGLNAEAERYEKHLKDWSFGVMQTLTETAFALCPRVGLTPPDKPVPRGGDADKWRAFLFDPRNSILIGVAFLDYQDDRFAMLGDPVLSYAAYNAGSPRVNLDRPWGVHYFRHESDSGAVYDAMNTFVAWYGDACVVFD